MRKSEEQMMLGLKVAIFLYIVLSPFINHNAVMFMNGVGFKIAMIVLIVIASFIDLQLAILMTLGLLVLVINLNKDTIFKTVEVKKKVITPEMLMEHFAVGMPLAAEPVPETITQFPDKCEQVKTFERDAISEDLYNVYIDPKIKPYVNYINMLSSPDLVEAASNGAYNT